MNLKTLIPALEWIGSYKPRYLTSDLMAGLIIAVMLVPQGMAYALLAGLPPVVGLYASTIPLFAYALFGSSKQLAVGPVAISSLITLSGVSALAQQGSAEFIGLAALLALMVGGIQLLLGVVRAGFLTNFISHAVISGFTSAAAIIIALSQLQHLLGIGLEGGNVFQTIWEALNRIGETNLVTLTVGGVSIATLYLLGRFAKRFPAAILVVVLSTLAVYLFRLNEYGVNIVAEVPSGLPSFALPAFSVEAIGALVPIALTVSFVNFMESIAVAKAIASKEKYKIDANRELIGLGFANIVGGFFRAYPVAGAFSRTAVNHQAGAKTQLASVITALLIIITLLFLTPLFYYLPNAVLAAIVMVAVLGLVDIGEPIHLFQLKPIDGWTLVTTFTATLVLGVVPGLLIGVGFSLLVFVGRSAYPHTAELGRLEKEGVYLELDRYPEAQTFDKVFIARMDASLYFANMSYFETLINDAVADRPNLDHIVLDFSPVNDMDAVALETLENEMETLAGQNITVHIAEMKGPVRDLAEKAGWFERYGERVAYLKLEDALVDIGVIPDAVDTRKSRAAPK